MADKEVFDSIFPVKKINFIGVAKTFMSNELLLNEICSLNCFEINQKITLIFNEAIKYRNRN